MDKFQKFNNDIEESFDYQLATPQDEKPTFECFKPLILVPEDKVNSTLSKKKKGKKKDFKVFDSTNKCMEFHTIMIGSETEGEDIAAKVSKLQAEINNENDSFQLWFEVYQANLNALESYIYCDRQDSEVDYANAFNMLKVALALEDSNLTNDLLNYIDIKDEKVLKEVFSNKSNLSFLLDNTLDLLLFLLSGKSNSKLSENKKALGTLKELCMKVIEKVINETNFDAFLSSLFMNVDLYQNSLLSQILDTIGDNVYVKDNLSKQQKVKFLNEMIKIRKEETSIKNKIITEKLKSIIFQENVEDFEDIDNYQKALKLFKIEGEDEIKELKERVILKGFSNIKVIKMKLKENEEKHQAEIQEQKEEIMKLKQNEEKHQAEIQSMKQEMKENKEKHQAEIQKQKEEIVMKLKEKEEKHEAEIQKQKEEIMKIKENEEKHQDEIQSMMEVVMKLKENEEQKQKEIEEKLQAEIQKQNEIEEKEIQMQKEKLKDNEYEFLRDCMPNDLKNFKLNLLYKATKDGFSASSFHGKCDNKPGLLVIITSENENRLGGYIL